LFPYCAHLILSSSPTLLHRHKPIETNNIWTARHYVALLVSGGRCEWFSDDFRTIVTVQFIECSLATDNVILLQSPSVTVMTLAITCYTSNHTVQVSDRRLVWLTGKNAGQPADDNRNKVLVVCNRLAISYTGLAEIEGSKTDDWLLETVSTVNPYNPQRVIKTIADKATQAFRNIRLPAPKKTHAFLVSGWARLEILMRHSVRSDVRFLML